MENEKKKRDKKPFIIIILIVILGVIIFLYNNQSIFTSTQSTTSSSTSSTTETTQATAEIKTIEKTITSTSQIATSLDEKLSLHATYYFSEIYFSESDYVAEGENILKYTNGTYMTAPYNLVISSISVPSVNGQCTNSNYIEVYAIDTLTMSLSISEDDLQEVEIG